MLGRRFRASALPALKARNLDPDAIDAIVLSHLHGIISAGCRFCCSTRSSCRGASRPLLIAGAAGTKARLERRCWKCSSRNRPGSTMEVSWSGSGIEAATRAKCQGISIDGRSHPSIRCAFDRVAAVRWQRRVLLIPVTRNGPTRLLPIAKDADLFICECYDFRWQVTGHLDLGDFSCPQLLELAARRTMLTHMNPSMLARLDEVHAAGVLLAEDRADARLPALQPCQQAARCPSACRPSFALRPAVLRTWRSTQSLAAHPE